MESDLACLGFTSSAQAAGAFAEPGLLRQALPCLLVPSAGGAAELGTTDRIPVPNLRLHPSAEPGTASLRRTWDPHPCAEPGTAAPVPNQGHALTL